MRALELVSCQLQYFTQDHSWNQFKRALITTAKEREKKILSSYCLSSINRDMSGREAKCKGKHFFSEPMDVSAHGGEAERGGESQTRRRHSQQEA